ncbi:MAG: mechanosensitive ion channel family protein [Desulfarculus sp.]|nr:mechanosensitive ion channel family protein [Desulfarculus sp.]
MEGLATSIQQAWHWLGKTPLLDPETLLGAVVVAVLIALACSVASRLLGRVVRRSSGLITRLARGQVDETVLRYALRIKTVLVFLMGGVFYASLVPALRGLLGTLVASAGITALVMGFAAKSTMANLIAGLSLAFYRPIRIGDKVTIEGEYGTVEDITLRHTIVRTWEAKRLVIPNEKIDQMTLVNYSIVDSRTLLALNLGIAYEADLDLARRLILEEVAKCPAIIPPEQASAPPAVRVIDWGDSALKLRVNVWVPDMDAYYAAKAHLLEAIKHRFDQEGVEIPYPHQVVLRKAGAPAASEPTEGEPGR